MSGENSKRAISSLEIEDPKTSKKRFGSFSKDVVPDQLAAVSRAASQGLSGIGVAASARAGELGQAVTEGLNQFEKTKPFIISSSVLYIISAICSFSILNSAGIVCGIVLLITTVFGFLAIYKDFHAKLVTVSLVVINFIVIMIVLIMESEDDSSTKKAAKGAFTFFATLAMIVSGAIIGIEYNLRNSANGDAAANTDKNSMKHPFDAYDSGNLGGGGGYSSFGRKTDKTQKYLNSRKNYIRKKCKK